MAPQKYTEQNFEEHIEEHLLNSGYQKRLSRRNTTGQYELENSHCKWTENGGRVKTLDTPIRSGTING